MSEPTQLVAARLAQSVIRKLDEIARDQAGEMGRPSRALVLEAAIERLWAELKERKR